jgi:hypothetical protein
MWQSAHNQPSKHFPIINRKVFLIISRRGKHPADIIYIRVIETGLCKGQRNSIEIKPKNRREKGVIAKPLATLKFGEKENISSHD